MIRSAAGGLLLLLAACRPDSSISKEPWVRTDLWRKPPSAVEMAPAAAQGGPPFKPEISYLGAEEVRDMSQVPANQLVTFPRRTAGQVRALETMAGTRLRWTLRLQDEPFFSFIPLGSVGPCACVYRVGVRSGPGQLEELYRVDASPVGPFAPATVEVDLARYAGRQIDLLIQLEPPPGLLPGQPVPTALWGSPALVQRQRIAPSRHTGERPNILLIGIDTLRADELGSWGRAPSLTPSLDRFAEESDVWLDAFTAFNATNPSFASMMTGLYGKNHGVYDLKTPLPRSQTTLAERLGSAGYASLAVISASHLGDHNSGLGQGFGQVVTAGEHFSAELATDDAMEWLDGHRETGKPFFVWLHLFDPHTPHTPPQPFALGFRPASAVGMAPIQAWVPFRQPGPRSFVEQVLGGQRDLYDGEVAYLDRQVGRLLDFLKGRGLLENTVVVVVADHGESLGEHGVLFRHLGLHDTTTHVPLMIRWPGERREGRKIHGLVQTLDLFPTLLKTAGLAVPPQDGRDLRELTGDDRPGRRAVFAEHSAKLGLMVRTERYKYILSWNNARFFPDGPSLFDLKADPGENRNLAGQGLAAEKEMEGLLRGFLADRRARPEALPREQTDEEKARLKALGYG
jgi:arylsulfatase A-like enzyme